MATAAEALAEVRGLLAARGVACAKLEPVSPPGRGRRAGRVSLRVETRDGRVLKVRRLESAAEAARLAELCGRSALDFLPAGEAHGCLLIEAWIEGETLSSAQADARAGELGALLGRLHAATPPLAPGDGPPRVATAPRAARARGDLAALADLGVLPRAEAERLRRALAAHDPESAPTRLVHRDFCPENLVSDRAGRLHLVDNEWLGLDAAGVDLGRSWSRWAVADDAWSRFLEGYADAAPAAPEALVFWLVAMAARSAMVRLQADDAAAETLLPVRRLRELAG